MGFWSSVGDACSAVVSTVSSVCSAVVDTAVSVTKGIGTFVGEIGKLAIGAIKLVVGLIVKVCQVLGLIEADEDPEELGDKVLQAQEEGITPESCENYEEYAKKIRNFKLDPEKSKKHSQVDKLVAAGVYSEGALINKYGFGLGKMMPLIVKDAAFQNPEKIANLFESCEKNNTTMDNMADYLGGNLRGARREEAKSVYDEAQSYSTDKMANHLKQ